MMLVILNYFMYPNLVVLQVLVYNKSHLSSLFNKKQLHEIGDASEKQNEFKTKNNVINQKNKELYYILLEKGNTSKKGNTSSNLLKKFNN